MQLSPGSRSHNTAHCPEVLNEGYSCIYSWSFCIQPKIKIWKVGNYDDFTCRYQFCAKSKCVSLSASDCRSMLKQMVSNIYAQGAVFRMAEVPLGGRNQNLQLMDILTNRIQHEIQGSLIVKHTSLWRTDKTFSGQSNCSYHIFTNWRKVQEKGHW